MFWDTSRPSFVRACPRTAEGRVALEGRSASAWQDLKESLGADPDEWRWGRMNRSEFPHSLVEAYDLPLGERTGGAGTVAAIGATYRQIIDFSDLDRFGDD